MMTPPTDDEPTETDARPEPIEVDLIANLLTDIDRAIALTDTMLARIHAQRLADESEILRR